MIRLYIIVEGQSEEAFVNELLVPFLCDYGILALACLVGKPGHKGGLITYNKAKFDILKLLKQDQRAYCTTMFDYYALPTSFPGMPITARTTTEKAALVEAALLNDIASTLGDGFDPKRFLPYIQMHEYEGILFSDPELLAESMYKLELKDYFREIRESFVTPEEINEGRTTAPSKRILAIYPEYQKPFNGVRAAKAIGLTKIRQECPHFNAWLERLLAIAEN